MSRLPTPGQDNGNWGEILNDFLGQSHNTDGSLKDSALPKSTNVTTDGSSDTKIPSVKAIKDYTDGKVGEVNTQLAKIVNRINVVALGVDPTGEQDCFYILTEAMSANTPCILYFPGGTYKISQAISILGGVVLEGVGTGKTIIKLATGAETGNIVIRNSYSGLRDMTIQGDPAGTIGNGVRVGNPDSLDSVNLYGIVLGNLEICDCAQSGFIHNASTWLVQSGRVEIHDCGETGLAIAGSDSSYSEIVIRRCKRNYAMLGGSNNRIDKIKSIYSGIKRDWTPYDIAVADQCWGFYDAGKRNQYGLIEVQDGQYNGAWLDGSYDTVIEGLLIDHNWHANDNMDAYPASTALKITNAKRIMGKASLVDYVTSGRKSRYPSIVCEGSSEIDLLYTMNSHYKAPVVNDGNHIRSVKQEASGVGFKQATTAKPAVIRPVNDSLISVALSDSTKAVATILRLTSGNNLFCRAQRRAYTQNTNLSMLDTGLRAASNAGGGTYLHATVPICNLGCMLGKTLTLKADMAASAANTPRLVLCTMLDTGAIGSVIGSLTASGSGTWTVAASYTATHKKLGLAFYSNYTGTNANGNYCDYTNVKLEIGSSPTTYSDYDGAICDVNIADGVGYGSVLALDGENVISTDATAQSITYLKSLSAIIQEMS